MDIVDETLREWRRKPFDWRQNNCLLRIGYYILRCTGKDFTGPFIDACETVEDAQTLIRQYGDEESIIELAGLPRTNNPKRGDVALVYFQGKNEKIGGICTGPGIAMSLQRGVVELNVRHIQKFIAWEI